MKYSVDKHFSLRDGTVCCLSDLCPQDIDAIAQIECDASSHPWPHSHIADSLCSSHICVGVKVASSWVAHAFFSVAADEAELLLLAVDPNWQGRGVARQLLTIMCGDLSPPANMVFLEVRQSNQGAIAFYENCGFNQIGIRQGYYRTKSGSEDALIYAKHLALAAF